MNDRPAEMSRRRLLSLTAMGAGAAALGTLGALGSAAPASAALASHNEVNGQLTYYEIGGAASSFQYDPGFYSRLETWNQFWYTHTPTTWVKPLRLYTYGAYVNKPGAHGLGRAFDLSQLWVTSGGSPVRTFWGRHDLWQNLTGNALTTQLRWYWGTAASLHYHFRNVLTYPYNIDHRNHIHIDDLVSGAGLAHFDTTSVAQVKHVQACCTYVWGYPTAIDGVWGSQSSANSARALARGGYSGTLTSASANWQNFNRITTEYGTGRTAF
jgi:hypothetical protein